MIKLLQSVKTQNLTDYTDKFISVTFCMNESAFQII